MKTAKKITINYSIFSSTRMIIGIYHSIYLISSGITIKQIALLQAIFTITILISEIPIAIFSDTYSRKLSVLIGTALSILFYICCLYSPNIIILSLGEIFYGLAASFISGAIDGWIINKLDNNDEYTYYSFLSKRVFSIGSIFAGLSSYLLYYIYKNYNLLYIVSFVLIGFNLIIYMIIPQPPKYHKKLQEIKFDIKFIVKRNVVFYIITSILITMSMQILYHYWQPIMVFNEDNSHLLLSICYFGVFASQYIFSRLFMNKTNLFKNNLILSKMIILLLALIFFFKYIELKYLSIIPYIIMFGAISTIPIILRNSFVKNNSEMNNNISTVLSTFSFIERIFSLFLLAGIYIYPYTINVIYLLFIPIVLIFMFLLTNLLWRKFKYEY